MRDEVPRIYPTDMPTIPPVTEQEAVDGTAKNLPAYESMESEFVRQASAACKLTLALMDVGTRAFSLFDMQYRYPQMTQQQGDAVFDLVIAHIRSKAVSFDRKVAGVGYLIDTWFVVARAAPVPDVSALLEVN